MAPSAGWNYTRLEAIRTVFGTKYAIESCTQVNSEQLVKLLPLPWQNCQKTCQTPVPAGAALVGSCFFRLSRLCGLGVLKRS
eukprot:COSAG06_NODE_4152_length_4523_cov_3.332957_1_plen_82_part_00